MSLDPATTTTTTNNNNTTTIPPSNKQKLTINFSSRRRPVLPPDFLLTSWTSLNEALCAIHEQRPCKESEERLYGLVESLVLNKMSGELFDKLAQNVEARARELLATYSSPVKTSDADWLMWISHIWTTYSDEMRNARYIFLYLDSKGSGDLSTSPIVGTLISAIANDAAQSSSSSTNTLPTTTTMPHTTSSSPIYAMGVYKFKMELLKLTGLLERLVACSIRMIDDMRAHHSSEGFSHVSTCVRMLERLGLYYAHFEPMFLTSAQQFYTNEGMQLAKDLSLFEYCQYAIVRLGEESRRDYLEPHTRSQLGHVVDKCMILDQVTVLMSPARIDPLLQEFADPFLDKAKLSCVFVTMQRTHQLDLLKLRWSEFLRARGAEACANPDPIPIVLKLHNKAQQLVSSCFNGDEMFTKAMKDSFESFLNNDGSRTAELLAKFVDKRLRTRFGESQDETELILSQCIGVFHHVHAKDVFEEFYKSHLAKRLLLQTSTSTELEMNMVAKLKRECGPSFTNKLEIMFRDMNTSKALLAEWTIHAAAPSPGTFAHQLHVLSTGSWPSYPDFPTFVVPGSLLTLQKNFEEFYKVTKSYKDRRLTWKHSLGHCQLKARFPSGRYEFELSTFQAAVLLRFDEKREWTYEALLEATGIPADELERTISSMAFAKKESRVLMLAERGVVVQPAGQPAGKPTTTTTTTAMEEVMEGDGDDEDGDGDAPGATTSAAPPKRLVRNGDVFKLDLEFRSKRTRIKINQIQIKETPKERTETHAKVQGDRTNQIDAAIVRIMKSRKKSSHTLLVAELFRQLQFPIKAPDLKKRIESLIEREYLERDEADPSEYLYLA